LELSAALLELANHCCKQSVELIVIQVPDGAR
jgi:hypothetical protein